MSRAIAVKGVGESDNSEGVEKVNRVIRVKRENKHETSHRHQSSQGSTKGFSLTGVS